MIDRTQVGQVCGLTDPVPELAIDRQRLPEAVGRQVQLPRVPVHVAEVAQDVGLPTEPPGLPIEGQRLTQMLGRPVQLPRAQEDAAEVAQDSGLAVLPRGLPRGGRRARVMRDGLLETTLVIRGVSERELGDHLAVPVAVRLGGGQGGVREVSPSTTFMLTTK
ncbi:MAG TPA: hypothetical protein VFR67_28885 [Pilimelia sp.]|nr:hypothetical protein [Pilimelia sp.]